MFGTIDVARTQIAHQQLMTAEYIRGSSSAGAVKEATVLFTVYRVIGRIEVQYRFSVHA